MKRYLILFALFFLLSVNQSAFAKDELPVVNEQGLLTVNIQEAGTLKKMIKKKTFPLVKTLYINGEMGDKDWEFLEKLPNLSTIRVAKKNLEISRWSTFKNSTITTVEIFGQDSGRFNTGDTNADGWVAYFASIAATVRIKGPEDAFKNSYSNSFHRFTALRRVKFLDIFPPATSSSQFPVPDTLYVHTRDNDAMVLTKDGSMLFDLGKKIDIKQCHVIHIDSYNDETVKLEELPNAIYVNAKLALTNKKLTIPSHVCFLTGRIDGSYNEVILEDLKFEDGDLPLYIGMGGVTLSYGKGDIDKLDINRPVYLDDHVFKNIQVRELHFNKDIYYLGENNFKVTECTYFKKAPMQLYKLRESDFYSSSDNYPFKFNTVYVATDSLKKQMPEYFKVKVRTGKSVSLNLNLELPGSIALHMPKNLSDVDSITVTGFMYESDLSFIRNCENLTYLDLGKTIISESPAKKKRDKESAEQTAALFGLLGAMADMQYDSGQMNSMDYLYTKGVAKLIEESAEDVSGEAKGCVIPYASIYDMKKLKTLILPYRAEKIEGNFRSCTELETVVLPKYLKSFAGFENCPKLKEMIFGASLTNMHSDALENCTGLKKVYLADCNLSRTEWVKMFEGSVIEELWLPKNITYIKDANAKIIHVPASVKKMDVSWDNCTVYFESPTPPDPTNIRNSTLYIPKGSKTAYFQFYGHTNKYVEL